MIMKLIKTNKTLFESLSKLLIIHYSCTSVEVDSPITSISTKDTSLELAKTFSRDVKTEEDEIGTLKEFITYLNKKIQNDFYLVGWNWADNYGLLSILRRYKRLTGEDAEIDFTKIKYFDLLLLFRDSYKNFFGSYESLAKYNLLDINNVVPGTEEVGLYEEGKIQELNSSTRAKVQLFHTFIIRHANKTLQIPRLEEVYYSLGDIGSYNTFRHNLNNIEEMIRVKNNINNNHLQNFFRNLLFTNLVTIMETYLSEAFIKKVISNESYLKQYIKFELNKKKISMSELFSEMFNDIKENGDLSINNYIKHKCIEDMKNITFHNFNQVPGIYKDVLGVNFPEDVGFIVEAIDKRHHLIHRNGRDKNGRVIYIEIDYLNEAIEKVDKFITFIDKKLNGI